MNFAEAERISSQTQNISKDGFRFILTETRFPVENHDSESSAWQKSVNLPIIQAVLAESLHFQSFQNESENLSKVCPTLCFFEAKGSASLPSLTNLPFSEFES